MVTRSNAKPFTKKQPVTKASKSKVRTKKTPLKSRATTIKTRRTTRPTGKASVNQPLQPLHKKLIGAFIALAVITAGGASLLRSPASDAASAAGPITGIASKCLDNQKSQTVNGNKIQLYRCNGTPAQAWTIMDDNTIRVQGMCLDVTGSNKAEGTLVQLYKCNGTVAQKWVINSDKTIVNPNSGLCLDDQRQGSSDGNIIWMWHCNKTIAQVWTTPKVVSTQPAPAPTPTPSPSPAPAPDAADIVKWSAVAKPGENINTVLAKPALVGKILKLPTGVFEVSNFKTTAAIQVPAGVKGIVGSGYNTIIRIKTNTSTYAKSVPAQSTGQTNPLNVMKMNDGLEPQVLSDFWLQGTEQGHLYNGISIGRSKPGSSVANVLITGIPGNSNTPPGETFGLNWWKGSDSITRDVEIDGYRWTGNTYATRVKGPNVGASGFGYNSHDRAKLYNVNVHDHNYGMPTFWQSNDAETWNLQSIRNRIGINHERSFGTIHHRPVMYGSITHRHISFMSDIGDGTLTIIGATNDAWISTSKSGPISKGAKMLILSPAGYRDGSSIHTDPKVVLDDGKTVAPFLLVH